MRDTGDSIKVGDKVSKGSLLAKLENDSSNIDPKKDVPIKENITKEKTIEKKETININTSKIIKTKFIKTSKNN